MVILFSSLSPISTIRYLMVKIVPDSPVGAAFGMSPLMFSPSCFLAVGAPGLPYRTLPTPDLRVVISPGNPGSFGDLGRIILKFNSSLL